MPLTKQETLQNMLLEYIEWNENIQQELTKFAQENDLLLDFDTGEVSQSLPNSPLHKE